MKHSILIALVLTAPLATMAQTTVFNDTFNNGSTVQSASPAAPTANSTAYEWFQGGSAPSGQTIAAGDLHLAERSATSEIGEVQALFAPAPVTISTVGDWVDLTIVFTDTSGVLVSTALTGSSLNVGLFNSGGVLPNQGTRLSNGTTSGGSQNWNGYSGKFFLTGGSNPQFITRTPQTVNGTTSQNQDVVFAAQSGGGGYNNPAAVALASTSSTQGVTLTAASVYTLDYRITLSAINTLTISNAIYSGNSVSGGPLLSMIATTNDASGVYSYSALAFGWRETTTAAAASSVDISSITVNDLIQPAPEPSTIALSGLGILALGTVRRLKNNK